MKYLLPFSFKLRNFWPFELNIFIDSNVSCPLAGWRGQKDSWHFKRGMKRPDKRTIEMESDKIFFFRIETPRSFREVLRTDLVDIGWWPREGPVIVGPVNRSWWLEYCHLTLFSPRVQDLCALHFCVCKHWWSHKNNRSQKLGGAGIGRGVGGGC